MYNDAKKFTSFEGWMYPLATFSVCLSRRIMLLLLLSHFSRVRLCATPWTAAHQAPPSMGFSRQEHWSGVPWPTGRYANYSQLPSAVPTFNSVATVSNLEASDPPNKAQSSFRTNSPASDWWSVHDLWM